MWQQPYWLIFMASQDGIESCHKKMCGWGSLNSPASVFHCLLFTAVGSFLLGLAHLESGWEKMQEKVGEGLRSFQIRVCENKQESPNLSSFMVNQFILSCVSVYPYLWQRYCDHSVTSKFRIMLVGKHGSGQCPQAYWYISCIMSLRQNTLPSLCSKYELKGCPVLNRLNFGYLSLPFLFC